MVFNKTHLRSYIFILLHYDIFHPDSTVISFIFKYPLRLVGFSSPSQPSILIVTTLYSLSLPLVLLNEVVFHHNSLSDQTFPFPSINHNLFLADGSYIHSVALKTMTSLNHQSSKHLVLIFYFSPVHVPVLNMKSSVCFFTTFIP